MDAHGPVNILESIVAVSLFLTTMQKKEPSGNFRLWNLIDRTLGKQIWNILMSCLMFRLNNAFLISIDVKLIRFSHRYDELT